jgi:2,5-diketo-D-gluconate reductase A
VAGVHRGAAGRARALHRRLELPARPSAPDHRRDGRHAGREHAERGIVTEAWSPIAQGLVLDDPAIVAIAEAHGKSPAQVVLRWHIELGNVVFPKSMSAERLRENIDIFDFSLSTEEMAQIEALDRGERTGPDPDEFVRPS